MKQAQSKILIASLFIFSLISFFQNCAPPPKTSSAENNTSTYVAPPGLPAINYFKEPRPALLCGPDGWAYLQRNYIDKNCAGCHYQGSVVNSFSFGDRNINISFNNAKLITKSQWHTFTTRNGFCYPNCDILPEGEVYHGLMEWADNHDCP